MRLGNNERKVLLVLAAKELSKEQLGLAMEERASTTRKDIARLLDLQFLVRKRDRKGKKTNQWIWTKKAATKLTQTLSSLRRKGLTEGYSNPTLTDAGREKATDVLTEIESYINEWLPFSSEQLRKKIKKDALDWDAAWASTVRKFEEDKARLKELDQS